MTIYRFIGSMSHPLMAYLAARRATFITEGVLIISLFLIKLFLYFSHLYLSNDFYMARGLLYVVAILILMSIYFLFLF